MNGEEEQGAIFDRIREITDELKDLELNSPAQEVQIGDLDEELRELYARIRRR